MTERRDGDRIVVTGYSPGSHFPRQQEMMEYAWEADGCSAEGPWKIPGSVYGKDLHFRGPGEVGGSVLGRGDIKLNNPKTSPARFLGGLSANGSIVARKQARPLPESVLGDITRAAYVVRGDVMGRGVALEDAVVLGNVEANRVKLTRCIVFGACIASEHIVVEASTVLYYHAPVIRFEGPCVLIHAMGESHKVPIFAACTDGAGHKWPADVRYYPILRLDEQEGMSNRPWKKHGEMYDGARLEPSVDWVAVDAQERKTKLFDGEVRTVEVPAKRYVLSITGRALNYRRLKSTIRAISFMLQSGFEFEHYDANRQEQVRRQWDKSCTGDERVMMAMATNPLDA